MNVTGYTAGTALDPNGVVHLRGAIKSGTSNTVAFTLPAPRRPTHTLNLPISTPTPPASATSTAVGRLKIKPNGQVIPIGIDVSTYTGLDGISFGAGE